MTEGEYFETIRDAWDGELVVCALGVNGDRWWALTGSRESFYMNAAMGFASSFALGLALALPDERVWVLDSDGGTSMNLGGLLTQASAAPPNLVRLVMNNHGYASLGGQPLVNAQTTDYAAIARGAGIENVVSVDDAEALRGALTEASGARRHAFIVADVEPEQRSRGFEPPLSIPYEGAEMKYTFGRKIEERTGRRVFGPSGF